MDEKSSLSSKKRSSTRRKLFDTMDEKSSLCSKKRFSTRLQLYKNVPTTIKLSKNASFLSKGLPKKPLKCNVVESTLLNSSSPDHYRALHKRKSMTNSHRESPKLDNESIPNLDESIFEDMTDNSFDCLDTFVSNKKFKPKPFQCIKRTLPASVPKAVASMFTKLERNFFNEMDFDTVIQLLVDTLTDKGNTSESTDIIYHILKYFFHVIKNPILIYQKKKESSVLQPLYENIIAMALIKINRQPIFLNQGFLLSLIINIRQFILAMKTLPLQSACALCRLHTKICKIKKNQREPISLTCEILKQNHKFGPMLIASIAVEWRELFDISLNASEEETIFYGAIALGARKWPKPVASSTTKVGLKYSEWEISNNLVERYILVVPVRPNEETISYLFNRIEKKCLEESYSREYMLTSSLAIFAAYKGCHWATKYIVDKHLRRHIGRYADSCRNEKALSLYCKLYADVCSTFPTYLEPENILLALFETGAEDEANKYIQDASALPLIQLLLSKNLPLPDSVKRWIEDNENNPKFSYVKLLLHRANLDSKLDFTVDDLL